MKSLRIALLAAAVAVGAAGVASAQDQRDPGRDRGGDRRDDRGGRPEGARPDMRGGGQQAQPGVQQAQPGGQPQQQAERRDPRDGGDGRRDGPGDRGGPDRQGQGRAAWSRRDGPDGRGAAFAGRPGDDRRFDGRGGDDRRFDGRPGDGRRFDDRGPGYGGNRPGPDRAWRPGYNWRADRAYDWRGYRSTNRSIYSVGRYYAPRGWGYGYRRFSVGYRLPGFFYAQNYWLADPWQYRLPPAYGPYRWVRYYDDVLLVDLRTGQIADEIPDFFF